MMQISTAKSEEEIVKEAKGKGIKLAPLSHYFDGEEKESFENTYVVNYSSVDLQNIERAAKVLEQIMVKYNSAAEKTATSQCIPACGCFLSEFRKSTVSAEQIQKDILQYRLHPGRCCPPGAHCG